MGDWQLTMQLERHDEDITESLLTQIKEYISYLFLIIGTYLSLKIYYTNIYNHEIKSKTLEKNCWSS